LEDIMNEAGELPDNVPYDKLVNTEMAEEVMNELGGMSLSLLTLEHVSHHYFTNNSYTKALDDVSFSINAGEFVALLGPSGCGKTTILSIIAGIIQQTAGDVLLNNEPAHRSKIKIGYMLQQDYLFPWKTI